MVVRLDGGCSVGWSASWLVVSQSVGCLVGRSTFFAILGGWYLLVNTI